MVEDGDTDVGDADDKGGGASIGCAEELLVVVGHQDADEEGRDTVEDGQTPDEATSSLGDVAARSDRLASGNGDELGRRDKGEASGGKGVPVREEIARVAGSVVLFKSARIIVVVEPAHPRLVGPAAKEDDPADDDEATDEDELDTGKPELGLAKVAHGDNIEGQHDEQDDGDPDGNVDRDLPVLDDDASGDGLGADEHGVDVPVVPAGGEGETWVDETVDEVGDGDAAHGQVDDHLGEDVHDAPDDEHHGAVAHEEGGWAGVCEDASGADEEARSDGATW